MTKNRTIAISGNPNCGKSALFNALTGIRQKTGNWPGVTIDRKQGSFEHNNNDYTLIDLPGIYSLDSNSIDEQISCQYLLSGEADALLHVVDASNLERNLYLALQMREMNIPMVVVLNMVDVIKKRGIRIDIDALSKQLGCPVIPAVATKNKGLADIKQALENTISNACEPWYISYEQNVESAIEQAKPVLNTLPEGHILRHADSRWGALKLLEGSDSLNAQLNNEQQSAIVQIIEGTQANSEDDLSFCIADARYDLAHRINQFVSTQVGTLKTTTTDKVDRIVLNRWFGIPIFVVIMYLMFMFTINVGGAFIDFFDIFVGAIFVDGGHALLSSIGSPEWLNALIADGIGGGIQVVATFIPIVACLYIFLSILEDSGYMARAAFVMNRAMNAIGLPGKAFVPMIVAFGCNVPAIMAARTLENERERKMTILINPFMSCGARLPVYALFVVAFFPTNGQNLVFLLYIIGILAAIGTGLLFRSALVGGQTSHFMMELPKYHLPTVRGVLLRTWDRVRVFIKEAGQIIIIMVFCINVLNTMGTDGSWGNQDSEKSVLSAIGKSITPLFKPMGIKEENWPATVGIFTGILAKEAVVGTLDSLYTQMLPDENNNAEDDSEYSLLTSTQEALQTIPDNLLGVVDGWLDPLGLDVGETESQEIASEEQGVTKSIFTTMNEQYDGRIGAFAYLLFVLLYFPCVSVIGAIRREAGLSWAIFVASWTTGLAYIGSVGFYQAAYFTRHPAQSSAWLLGLAIVSAISVIMIRRWLGKSPVAQ